MRFLKSALAVFTLVFPQRNSNCFCVRCKTFSLCCIHTELTMMVMDLFKIFSFFPCSSLFNPLTSSNFSCLEIKCRKKFEHNVRIMMQKLRLMVFPLFLSHFSYFFFAEISKGVWTNVWFMLADLSRHFKLSNHVKTKTWKFFTILENFSADIIFQEWKSQYFVQWSFEDSKRFVTRINWCWNTENP